MEQFDPLFKMMSYLSQAVIILVPILIGIWYKVHKAATNKINLLKAGEIKKAKEEFDAWSHSEALSLLYKFREICNMYHDKSSADRVLYIQLENGSVSLSKIYNMYLTCVAEDNRYSEVEQIRKNIQRIPVQECIDLVNTVVYNGFIKIPDLSKSNYDFSGPFHSSSNSVKISLVRDKSGNPVGAVVFCYLDVDYNDKEDDVTIRTASASISAVLLTYEIEKDKRLEELMKLEKGVK